MTDVTKYKSLATDIEDYEIIAEIRQATGLPVKTIIKQCIALGKDAWLKTGKKYIARENPKDYEKNLIVSVNFVLVRDIQFLW